MLSDRGTLRGLIWRIYSPDIIAHFNALCFFSILHSKTYINKFVYSMTGLRNCSIIICCLIGGLSGAKLGRNIYLTSMRTSIHS